MLHRCFTLCLLALCLLAGCATTPPALKGEDRVTGPDPDTTICEVAEDGAPDVDCISSWAKVYLDKAGANTCACPENNPSACAPTSESREYCSAIYIASDGEELSWRLSNYNVGIPGHCKPPSDVIDPDFAPNQIWVVGGFHNHPCGSPPSPDDLGYWPSYPKIWNPEKKKAIEWNPVEGMASVEIHVTYPSELRINKNVVPYQNYIVAKSPTNGNLIILDVRTNGTVRLYKDGEWEDVGKCDKADRACTARLRKALLKP